MPGSDLARLIDEPVGDANPPFGANVTAVGVRESAWVQAADGSGRQISENWRP